METSKTYIEIIININISFSVFMFYIFKVYYPNYFLWFYRHASEICRMALDLQAACGMVVRPDIRPKTIKIQCGIHTGPVVAGNF